MQAHHMEECCDICGNIGVADAILACRQCNMNREHMYCMRVLLEVRPTDGWLCEKCQHVPKPTPQSSEHMIDSSADQSNLIKSKEVHTGDSSSRKFHVNWEKAPQGKPGKTMYMSANEAIMLGANITLPNIKVRHISSPTKPKIGPNKSVRTPVKPKTAPMSSFYQHTLASRPSQQLKLQKPNHVEPCEEQLQLKKLSEVRTSTSSLLFAESPRDAHVNVQKEKPTEVKSPAKTAKSAMMKQSSAVAPLLNKKKPAEVKSPAKSAESVMKKHSSLVGPGLNVPQLTVSEAQISTNNLHSAQAPRDALVNVQKEKPAEVKSPAKSAETVMKKHSSAVAPWLNDPQLTVPGAEEACEAENVNSNILPDSEKSSYAYAPSLDVVWKGSFNIQDHLKQGKLNHEIRACPPSRVHRKVYEFSKRMPEQLDLELVPRENIWLKLFSECVPDRRNVGLYLFPGDHQRAGDYISLVEYISAKNYALRIQIANVEFLVFSSKLLSVNCQCWEGKYFLWGVFCRVQRDTIAFLCKKGLSLPFQPPIDANCDHRQEENSNEMGMDMDMDMDMDIDMIGGITVGRTDVVVRKESLSKKSVRFIEESATASQIPSVSKFASLKVKSEPYTNAPPGFEPRVHQASKSWPRVSH